MTKPPRSFAGLATTDPKERAEKRKRRAEASRARITARGHGDILIAARRAAAEALKQAAAEQKKT